MTDVKNSNSTRIVILGSGFGGVYSYLNLHKKLHGNTDVEVVMVSENDHFLFLPLLHEIAIGNLPESSIRQPVRTMPQCCLDRFITGQVHGVDFDNQTIHYDRIIDADNDNGATTEDTLSYDYLVSALGSDTNYFGTPGAEQHSLPLKRLQHARDIKDRVVDQFEKAQTITDEDKLESALRFVIVGGGATGVELAGELGGLLEQELAQSFPRLCEHASVHLYESGDRLVKRMDSWFSRKVESILTRKKPITVHFGQRVQEVRPNGVSVGDEFVLAETTMWTAGVRAQKLDISAQKDVALEPKTDRVHVSDCLHIPNYPNVYVVGDQAWIKNAETGQPYPMRAQFAVREGQVAAENIARELRGDGGCQKFAWKDKGIILSLGEGGALAQIYGYHFSGFIAWWLYRLVYLAQIPGLQYKMRTFVEWMMNYFNPRDISKS